MTCDGSYKEPSKSKPKKPYSSPRLALYGGIAQLTLNGKEFGNDGNTECSGNADSAPRDCRYLS